MAKAKKGGEIGLNGEFYKGGQFVAGSEDTIKGMQNGQHLKPRYSRKMEVAPYKWELQPSPDHKAIFNCMGQYLTWDVFGQSIKAFTPGCEYNDKLQGFAIGTTEAIYAELAAKWNAGERWYI